MIVRMSVHDLMIWSIPMLIRCQMDVTSVLVVMILLILIVMAFLTPVMDEGKDVL